MGLRSPLESRRGGGGRGEGVGGGSELLPPVLLGGVFRHKDGNKLTEATFWCERTAWPAVTRRTNGGGLVSDSRSNGGGRGGARPADHRKLCFFSP